MQTPTIHEIIEATKESYPYFFDQSTLKGFGQTLESFTIVKSPKDKIFIYAPSYWGSIIKDSHIRVHAFGQGYQRQYANDYPKLEGKNLMGYTFREFTGNSLTICDCEKDLESVLEYIKTH